MRGIGPAAIAKVEANGKRASLNIMSDVDAGVTIRSDAKQDGTTDTIMVL